MIAFIHLTEKSTDRKILINVGQITHITESQNGSAVINVDGTLYFPVEEYADIHERLRTMLERA